MERELKFFDADQFERNYIEPAKELIEKVTEFISRFNNLELEKITTTKEVKELFDSTKVFLYQKMSGGDLPKINGIQIDFKKAYDISVIPKNVEALVKDIEDFKAGFIGVKDLSIIEMSEGEIKLTDAYKDNGKEACSVYANNDNEKKLFEFVENFKEKVEANFTDKNITLVFERLISPAITYISYSNSLTINYKKVRSFIDQQQNR